MPNKEVLQINEDEMLLSSNGVDIIFMGRDHKDETLKRLRDREERAKELFQETFKYLMTMSKPKQIFSDQRAREYYRTSTLLLRTLRDIKKAVKQVDAEELLPRAQKEVEKRLYGKPLNTSVSEELFNG